MQFLLVIMGVWLATFLLYALIDAIVICMYILWSLSLARIFSKLNEESWKAYVPFYNMYIVMKASGLQIYYAIGFILPFFGRIGWMLFYIYLIYLSVMLARKFGKKKQFLLNLMIAPPLYLFELGKDNSMYEGDYNKDREDEI